MAEATARIALPDPEHLSAAQQAVYDAIKSGPRGVVRGPALIWLHSPEYAARVQRVSEFLRWDTVLGQRLSELAILITARHYNAHFIWFNHHELAAENGVSAKVIDAIKNRRRPDMDRKDEEAIYFFTTEMLETHDVSEGTLARIVALFGEKGAIELGALIGHYHLGAITLATARISLPDGSRTCLPD
jgi:4-carboxymuconolactone decarboxylase